MTDLLKGAPNGFTTAVQQMNTLPAEIIFTLSCDVAILLQNKIGVVNLDKLVKMVQDLNTDIDRDTLQSIVNAVTYLFRWSTKAGLSSEEFSGILESSSLFQAPTCSALTTVWSQQRSNLQLSNEQRHVLGVGQLLDLQWKLGMAVTSDQCRNLNSPYVTLTFTVGDPGGSVRTHTVEMSTAQFRNFSKQLKDIQKMMEVV
ncbi:COMM domain-containing protein 6-like isoform X1 [Dreissena polymorpha]|uniref:COMM domain-containing protein 6 n=2 Tax=Dreissena polymorpha TaxID=45954 RepID=A0A9D4QHW3_DREPO|nr:COMM domain-containing protein 6-like isoform X1 [Dreissena polymorpha]KAH3832334.1 hypothetical protein DPMN_105619 [Dreissena polymorpha]